MLLPDQAQPIKRHHPASISGPLPLSPSAIPAKTATMHEFFRVRRPSCSQCDNLCHQIFPLPGEQSFHPLCVASCRAFCR
jgi:hypothetical protein